MRKITFLAKAMGLASFLFIGIAASAQMELKIQTELSTRFSQVNDAGKAAMVYGYYDFTSDEITPLDSDVFTLVSINNNEDIAGSMFYDEPNFILQAAYRKDNVWNAIDFLPGQNPENDAFDPYKISPNSKYVVGQLSIGWDYAGFLFDTETEELVGAFDPEGESGAFYSVNDNGIAVGWIDRPDNFGTLRVPAYRTLDGEFHFIPEGELPEESQINTIFDINSSDVMVGDFDLQPYIYDKATDTFTSFDNPGGSFEAAFASISENGVAVGFAEVGFQTRDAIIYHPSLGDQPVFIKDLLIDNGIPIDTFDGLLGTAISVSPNGKYIAGWLNGPPMFAEGWMLYLDDILGTNDVNQTQISVYPNPVENVLHINATDKVDSISIFNILGQQITDVIIADNNRQIDVSGLASGVYMVKVISNSSQETFKIVKE